VKPTIFMIHGMWGKSAVWTRYRNFFEAEGYPCIIPTLPFHDMAPDSPPNAALGRISLLDYVDDLKRQISTLDSKPVIMGHSMGGLLAQMLAERGQAHRLVLLASAPSAGLQVFNISSARSLFSEISKLDLSKRPVRITYKEAAYGLLNRCPDGLKRELYDAFVYESGRATFEIAFWYFDRKRVARVDEKKVACPALIVAGMEDRIVPISIARRIAKKYQGIGDYRKLKNHAHWLLAEPGWEKIAGMIKDWLG